MNAVAADNRGNFRVCLIAGAPRCGTTSLYRYLLDHPGVCGSLVKQSGFFLSQDYDRVANRVIASTDVTLQEFERLFPNSSEKDVLIDATPDYLYSPGTAALIDETLAARARIVFLLRHPVEQFSSLFTHYKRLQRISPDCTADQFALRALDGSDALAVDALEQGRYADYLGAFSPFFERGAVSTFFTEELEADPQSMVSQLATALGVDPAFYADYRFSHLNAASSVRSGSALAAYRWARRTLLALAVRLNRPGALLIRSTRPLARVYHRLNGTPAAKPLLSASVRARLVNAQADSVARLVDLIGRPVPWPEFADSSESAIRSPARAAR